MAAEGVRAAIGVDGEIERRNVASYRSLERHLRRFGIPVRDAAGDAVRHEADPPSSSDQQWPYGKLAQSASLQAM